MASSSSSTPPSRAIAASFRTPTISIKWIQPPTCTPPIPFPAAPTSHPNRPNSSLAAKPACGESKSFPPPSTPASGPSQPPLPSAYGLLPPIATPTICTAASPSSPFVLKLKASCKCPAPFESCAISQARRKSSRSKSSSTLSSPSPFTCAAASSAPRPLQSSTASLIPSAPIRPSATRCPSLSTQPFTATRPAPTNLTRSSTPGSPLPLRSTSSQPTPRSFRKPPPTSPHGPNSVRWASKRYPISVPAPPLLPAGKTHSQPSSAPTLRTSHGCDVVGHFTTCS